LSRARVSAILPLTGGHEGLIAVRMERPRLPGARIAVIQTIQFQLNGAPATVKVEGDRKLLWVLRTELGLTGTKFGCGESTCGACTTVVNGEAVRSCQVPIASVQGKQVLTIEGLAHGGALHPLQAKFIENGGMQCGFCTSGMIMNAYALLKQNPHPSREQIIAGMDGNLCRCSAHRRILKSIEEAAAGR
jgi:aerobic-type carbon monoxide dehydrogenase small subunit (CoxS/CutS family)